MNLILKYFIELRHVLFELSPWLIFGMFVAGLLHVLLPPGFIHRSLGKKGFFSVVKASALGVPLPLCSCGVIPAAMGLKKDGASNGAALGFLISTPQTGIDSIMVSASFLGLPFALFKVVSALVTGLIGGIITNFVERSEPDVASPPITVSENDKISTTFNKKFIELFRFGYGRVLRDIYGWIIIGILIAALIGTIVPDNYFAQYSWMQGLSGMILMLLISLPLYICAVASVPIAAGLIAAGLPVGSALVFLLAGPATNVATIGAVYKGFGRRVTVIYLTTVISMSVILGWAFQSLISPETAHAAIEQVHFIPIWLSGSFSVILLILFSWFSVSDFSTFVKRQFLSSRMKESDMKKTELNVNGMTCPNCVAHVKRAIESTGGISDVDIELESGRVSISGESNDSDIFIKAIEDAGYSAKKAQEFYEPLYTD